MSETLEVKFICQEQDLSAWQGVMLCLKAEQFNHQLQDALDEVQANAGDLLDELFEEFAMEDCEVLTASLEDQLLSFEMMVDPSELDEMIEAFERVFSQLPVQDLRVDSGCDDAY